MFASDKESHKSSGTLVVAEILRSLRSLRITESDRIKDVSGDETNGPKLGKVNRAGCKGSDKG